MVAGEVSEFGGVPFGDAVLAASGELGADGSVFGLGCPDACEPVFW
ncbi:MAG TPA: hypothetical protein VFW65_34650 [Pseudonocardiaceae bacterium]|nr:hypothetical protein [Pseudonocardiaceae bacterium]